jgi:ribosome maturation factor RimP
MILREPKIEDVSFLEEILFAFRDFRIADVRRSNRGKVLDITVHNPDKPVTGDDCDRISEVLSNSAEFYDHFGAEIAISVASPGVERKLSTRRELEVFAGREIKVHYETEKGPCEMIGTLLSGSAEGHLNVSAEGQIHNLPLEQVRAVKLYYDFDQDDI